MPSPGCIVSNPRLYELARSKTSADPAVSPLLQAHVLRMRLDAERRPNAPDALVPIGFHRSVTSTSYESVSRRGCDGLRLQIASIRPSLFPGSQGRRVPHAPRPLALPPARAGLLHQHDTEHDAPSDCEATARLLDAPRAYTTRGTSPRTPYHVHALKGEQHLTPAHPRYGTQQALPFLQTRAARINLRAWQRSSADQCSRRAPQLGCATPPPCTAPHASNIPLLHTPLSSPPAHDDHLRRSPILAQPQLPSAPPPACAALAVAVLHRWRRTLLLPAQYDH
ncbi:hypothetical protein B0H13DRAFT_2665100 [Mycena leptocephala]|nr:hypothetical protein B0H13DRAFT_2665100 [Mycena leptocephala]